MVDDVSDAEYTPDAEEAEEVDVDGEADVEVEVEVEVDVESDAAAASCVNDEDDEVDAGEYTGTKAEAAAAIPYGLRGTCGGERRKWIFSGFSKIPDFFVFSGF
jgi:hypothetical protein